ncbi:MAG: tRNA 2-thiouridine(34) synthase MnmA [Parcubacteria group bacterium]|nr:tRNA 2-thiouridine(34) synthase MnmA [Parcubacteria group bacterium]
MSRSEQKTVYVAMSGGVDSSVAAFLLKQAKPNNFKRLFGRPTPKGFRGYNVVGVFMKPWQSQLSTNNYQPTTNCMWEQDREDAVRVAAKIGIPILTWDLSNEYEKKVTNYMINGYRQGLTPNPDVMCNKHIKFGAFLKKALKEGADYIATGHYAGIKRRQVLFGTRNSPARNFSKLSRRSPGILPGTMPAPSQITSQSLSSYTFELHKGKDQNKDQSYFLYTLTQKELKHCLFPIGDYTKPEVRKLAKKFGLPNWDKKESQGVCFVGDLKMNEFLKNYIKPKPGNIVYAKNGQTVGKHDGIYYYTIGQRHGLNIQGNGKTYFVSGKDIKKNTLFVDTLTKESQLFKTSAILKNMTWTNNHPDFPFKVTVKTRYRQPDQEAIVKKNGTIKFLKPQKAITPGQSAVIYQKDIVLGGGIIT